MKKIIFLLTVILLFFISNVVFSEETDVDGAEVALEETLQYLVDKDIENYADNIENERFPSREQALFNFDEIVTYDPVLDYEILKVTEENADEIVFSVEIELERVFIKEPYTMVQVDDEWKLLLTEEGLTVDEYEVKEKE